MTSGAGGRGAPVLASLRKKYVNTWIPCRIPLLR